MAVALAQRGPALALEVVDRSEQAPASAAPSPLDDRTVAALAEGQRTDAVARAARPLSHPRRHAL
jgi:hypothetical protein